jgi:hypothetical protein
LVRFSLLAQKAAELAQEVKNLGAGLLTALEKEDNEALAILRAGHERVLLESAESVKYGQLQEATKSKEAQHLRGRDERQDRVVRLPRAGLGLPGQPGGRGDHPDLQAAAGSADPRGRRHPKIEESPEADRAVPRDRTLPQRERYGADRAQVVVTGLADDHRHRAPICRVLTAGPAGGPGVGAIAKRFIGSIRRELLDRIPIINERHAGGRPSPYERYYNDHRPHRTLGQAAPQPLRSSRTRAQSVTSGD